MADEVYDTIFGKIVRIEVPIRLLHEEERCVVIKDIHPQAPVHLLVIYKKEINALENADDTDEEFLGRMLLVASNVVKEQGLATGYRIVINNGKDGGQTVYHFHLHVLGGKQMTWPPG